MGFNLGFEGLKTKALFSLGKSGISNYTIKYQNTRVFNMNAVGTSNLAFIGVCPEYQTNENCSDPENNNARKRCSRHRSSAVAWYSQSLHILKA
jgi:hypothetical protein